MVVGILKVSLHIQGSRSLKDKRRVVRSVKERVKRKFNVSIGEVDSLDNHQTAQLGVCVVSTEVAHADSQLNKTLDLISSQADVSDFSMEFINL